MCGICGIVNKDGSSVDLNFLGKMNDLAYHRGPDYGDLYCNSNVGLGHRRLAIIDLDNRSSQPMTSIDENYIIVFNGEIYNFIEIKNELISFGFKFKTESDTEVILYSYVFWGNKCVEKFNGMWSFVIYDKLQEILFCSRDRFGVKPFYFLNDNDNFYFSSEIKQILVDKKRIVNYNVLLNYLYLGCVDYGKETFFEGVKKLDPGHNLVYSLKSNTIKIIKYFDIVSNLNNNDDGRDLGLLLTDSIKLRLQADTKVATCLSGGLDSSTIATIASKLYRDKSGNNFSAITAISENIKYDESKYAKVVVESSRLEWLKTEPSYDDFVKSIDNVIFYQEEPFDGPSIFMQYFVMKKSRENHIPVLLDGQGGDEIFAGYQKYIVPILFDFYRQYGLVKALKELISLCKYHTFSFKLFFKYLIGTIFPSLRSIALKRDAFFLKKDFLKFKLNLVYEFSDAATNSLQDLLILELKKTNLPALLRYEDKNSMAWSVESRLPFLDYRVVINALKLDSIHRMQNGFMKFYLRNLNVLDDKIRYRRSKLGFAAPSEDWLLSYDTAMYDKIKHSKILNEISNINMICTKYHEIDFNMKWRLFNIAKWEEIFNVGTK